MGTCETPPHTSVSLRASTVTTLDTAMTVLVPQSPVAAASHPGPVARGHLQRVLRAAVDMLMEDRRLQPQGPVNKRPVP